MDSELHPAVWKVAVAPRLNIGLVLAIRTSPSCISEPLAPVGLKRPVVVAVTSSALTSERGPHLATFVYEDELVLLDVTTTAIVFTIETPVVPGQLVSILIRVNPLTGRTAE